jgi:phosphomannomutase
MDKKKIALSPSWDPNALLAAVADAFADEQVTTIDGVKIDFEDSWIHLRKSNTEPIIRLYGEAKTKAKMEDNIKKIEAAITAFVASA